MMRRGLAYSVALHASILLVLLFGSFTLFTKPPVEEQIITVTTVPISEITNIKAMHIPPAVKKEKPKDVSTKTPPKMAQPEAQKTPDTDTAKETPKEKVDPQKELLPDKTKPKEKKKPKPKEKPKNEKKKKQESNDFGAVLKSVETFEEKKEEKKEDTDKEFEKVEDFVAQQADTLFNPELPLTVNERQAIFQQIRDNWIVPAGARDAENMIIHLSVSLATDGSVTDVKITDQGRYSSDNFFRAAADSAVRAIRKSSPLKGLPAEKYDAKDGWREMELTFDPRQMLY